MIRKLLLPLATAVLLAGCVSDYTYRAGPGDYYYGQPRVEYRYPYGYGGYGGYLNYGYGYPYGYPRYGYYGYPYYRHGFGYPGYGYPGYGYPYRGYPHHRPRPPVQRPDGGGFEDGGDRRPPWRDFNSRRRPIDDAGGASPAPARPQIEPRQSGSRMEQIMRRARDSGAPTSADER